MSLLFHQKFTLKTNLSADEAKRRLVDVVDQTYDLFDREKPYRGEIFKYQFSIQNNNSIKSARDFFLSFDRDYYSPVIEGMIKDNAIDFKIKPSSMTSFGLLPILLLLILSFKNIILLFFAFFSYVILSITISYLIKKDKEFLTKLFTEP